MCFHTPRSKSDNTGFGRVVLFTCGELKIKNCGAVLGHKKSHRLQYQPGQDFQVLELALSNPSG